MLTKSLALPFRQWHSQKCGVWKCICTDQTCGNGLSVMSAFLLCVVLERFVRSPIVSGPVSAEMSLQAALTAGPARDGCGPGSKDGAFGLPGSVPRLWHRLGRGMRCILFVFIWIKTNVRFPWLRAACMLDDQLFGPVDVGSSVALPGHCHCMPVWGHNWPFDRAQGDSLSLRARIITSH